MSTFNKQTLTVDIDITDNRVYVCDIEVIQTTNKTIVFLTDEQVQAVIDDMVSICGLAEFLRPSVYSMRKALERAAEAELEFLKKD